MNFKKISGIVVVIAVLGFIGYSVFGNNNKETAKEVTTEKVSKNNVVEILSTTGTVAPNASQNLFGQGVVKEVNVAVGDVVEKDATLITYVDGTTVKAGIPGTVTTLDVKVDDIDLSSQTGTPVAVISDLSSLKVEVALSKSDATSVKVDQKVTLKSNDKAYEGHVSQVDLVATSTTSVMGTSNATLNATIAFDSATDGLIAGFEIDADITTATADQVLSIPVEALLYNNKNEPYVFVVKDGKAEKLDIEVGIQSDKLVEVTSGLAEGDKVILSPSDSMKNKTAVKEK